MGDLVNLKRFRKRAERKLSAKEAEANRAHLAKRNPNVFLSNSAPSAPATCSISIGSMARTHHEIAGRKTLDRRRRSQDQRQPRGGFLEWHEGDLRIARYDIVRAGRRNRQQPPARQSLTPPFGCSCWIIFAPARWPHHLAPSQPRRSALAAMGSPLQLAVAGRSPDDLSQRRCGRRGQHQRRLGSWRPGCRTGRGTDLDRRWQRRELLAENGRAGARRHGRGTR